MLRNYIINVKFLIDSQYNEVWDNINNMNIESDYKNFFSISNNILTLNSEYAKPIIETNIRFTIEYHSYPGMYVDNVQTPTDIAGGSGYYSDMVDF